VASEALHGNRQRAGSFGDDAEQYDRVRPPYPGEMVDALLTDDTELVLDVGCGTGIAARLFMARGCQVLGIEPDPRMAAVARRRGMTVEDGAFEQWDADGRQFDLLVAGQAWHWVDPQAGAVKAAEVLRPGGRLGLFWNQSFPGPQVRDAMVAVYGRHAPELGEGSVLMGQRGPWLYESIADAVRASGCFGDVIIRLFEHEVTYTTEQWIELATTHSDHRTLPSGPRHRLLAGLRTALDAVGGRVPVRYETTLVTAQTLPPG
jgi:SAM-dependent methyltransferase